MSTSTSHTPGQAAQRASSAEKPLPSGMGSFTNKCKGCGNEFDHSRLLFWCDKCRPSNEQQDRVITNQIVVNYLRREIAYKQRQITMHQDCHNQKDRYYREADALCVRLMKLTRWDI